MSLSFTGTGQSANVAAAPIVGPPFTMTCFFKSASDVAFERYFIHLGSAGVENNSFSLLLDGSDRAIARARNTGNGNAVGATVTDITTWHFLAHGATSISSRFVLLDNTKTTDSTSRAVTGVSVTRIGAFLPGGSYANGKIAHVAIWNKVLSDAELALLRTGSNPLSVGASNLVAYWPLTNNVTPQPDDAGNNNLTVTGATYSSDNPVVQAAPATNPTITSVDADNVVLAGQTAVNIVMTGAGADGANAKIELVDGTITSLCTKTSYADTLIVTTIVQGNVRYGTVLLRVTTQNGLTATKSITLSPATGAASVNLTTVRSLVFDSRNLPSRLYSTPSEIINNCQVRYTGSGIAIANDGSMTWADTTAQMTWAWHNGTAWSPTYTWDLRGLFPQFDGPAIANFTFSRSLAITPIDLSGRFSDPDSTTGTYSIAGLNTGLTIGSSTGILSGTPTVATSGTLPLLVVRRTDPDGSYAESGTFTITVQVVIIPPVFSGTIPDSVVTIGEVFALNISVYFTQATSYALAGTVPGLDFDSVTGILSGVPTLETAVKLTAFGIGEGTPAQSNDFTVVVSALAESPTLLPRVGNASLLGHVFHWGPNADGSVDANFPNGDKPP